MSIQDLTLKNGKLEVDNSWLKFEFERIEGELKAKKVEVLKLQILNQELNAKLKELQG